MHEHLFVKNPELEQNYAHPEWDEDAALERARVGLTHIHKMGISTIVDLTVIGLGRFIPRIKRLAELVDVNIVVGTGYYTASDLPTYFKRHGPNLRVDVPDPLEWMFINDIEIGIADTGVRAGVIKVVTDVAGITPDVGRVLRAAALAHRRTGVPISTHTNAAARSGLLQQSYFREAGVDLTRVIIGHCGDTTDLSYLKELMEEGSTIGMDRFGVTHTLSQEERIMTVVHLCEQGYADRMVLSHDAAFFSINTEPSARLREAPDWHHALLSERIIPELQARGVSGRDIRRMMVENPARLLVPTSKAT
jgi:phosphotriesterase-related protein